MNQLDMKGRHAVITGGAAGLGFAIAQRMLASGATVTLWDRDEVALAGAAKALGAGVQTVQVDVTRHDSVVQAVAQTAPKVDALVNSAGITGPNTPLVNYPVDAWNQVMQVNINGIFHCCREIVPLMQRADYGRIVNIASVAGKDGNPNASAYSTSKAAVIGLTKSLGKELASTGIRVNCVCPGVIETPMTAPLAANPDMRKVLDSMTPMGRMGRAEEVAAAVLWLCSDQASFVTGHPLVVDGGATAV